jgi:hypothetical protein
MICAMRHSSTRLIVTLCACLFGAAFAQPAAAKSYAADRFDSVVRVLPDGSLDVTETVVFRFIDGTFKEVFREVPVRRTDGVEIVRAEIDGQTMPFGDELGTVSVRESDGRVRVLWRFRPVEQVTRTFVLNYRVRGAVRHEGDADVLVWRTTPSDHAYRIESSTTRFELPVQPQRPPGITTRKTGSHHLSTTGNVVEISTRQIAANGWVDAGFRFPARSVAGVAPRWQQRATEIDAGAPKWIAAAMLVFVAGLILLIAWRQSYDAPPPEPISTGIDSPQPPDDLNPGLSGALAANGRAALEHAMASIFALADRGVLAIEEEPRRMLGSRNFEITRLTTTGPLLPHQERMLDVMFHERSGSSQQVSLAKARHRLTSRWSKVAKAFQEELGAAGFLDEARWRLRRRYRLTAVVFMVTAATAVVPAIPLIGRFGPWPLLIAAALLAVGLASLIVGSTITVLSNEGVRRARRWRDYKRYLRMVAGGKKPALGGSLGRALPYAVALGLASAWAKFLKTQPQLAPPWFRALPTSATDSAAFVAFVAHGGAGATSGAHGGAGGGAAGGGASGAG